MDILEIKNLSFQYPETKQPVLQDISFSVRAGEFIVICGESGCGKSTLLRLVKRELSPFGERCGEILYQGVNQDVLDERLAASELGFVMQNPENQIVTDKVWHELAFGLESLGYSTSVIRRRVAEMANYFGIEDWFRKDTATLSGGQKQMLNLASVMVMQPKILLLDEPTAQLDPIAAVNFISTLQKLNHELGLTILLVEHRLEEVFPIADRVLMLTHGKLVYQDCPQNISFYFKQNFSEQNRLNQNPFKHMEAALPSAMRIYNALQNEDSLQSDTLQTDIECPLTVKEGRDYIIKNFDNQIDTVEEVQPQQKNKTVFELKQVWFRYEKEMPDILRGVNLSVYEGENLCILGGNGSGKTTTLGIAAGLLKAYQGTVLLHGKKIGKYDEKSLYRHNLALLPQNPQTVFLEQTVQKDFLEICKSMEYKKEEWNDRIQAVAEKMDIAHLLEQHPYDLSGGEQQKAALAKMLLLQPKILLLDEPTKGIDAHSKIKLSEILKKLKADGITLITVTHDVEFAAANADRCAMLFDGEVVSVDTPRAFFANNNFYTTAANRIARGQYTNAVLCEDVIALCKANGRKEVSSHA